MRLATPRHWQNFASAMRLAAILSGFFGALAGAATFKPPLLGALMVGISGVVDGCLVMALIGGTEIFLPRTRTGQWLAQRPFLASLALKGILYSGILALMFKAQLGPAVAVGFLEGEEAKAIKQQFEALQLGLLAALAAYITLLLLMLRQTAQIVGERTARAVILGRYHRPRKEERFFLFIDIVGSTPVAEKLGALSVHRYLNRIFQAAADPIDDSRGEVYQYVGDEMVITWLVEEGRKTGEAAGVPVRDRGGARGGGACVRARVWHGAKIARRAARRRGGDRRSGRREAGDRVPRRRDERHFEDREPDPGARPSVPGVGGCARQDGGDGGLQA